jgi:hypothetical protein
MLISSDARTWEPATIPTGVSFIDARHNHNMSISSLHHTSEGWAGRWRIRLWIKGNDFYVRRMAGIGPGLITLPPGDFRTPLIHANGRWHAT